MTTKKIIKKRYKTQDRMAVEGHDRVDSWLIARSTLETKKQIEEIAKETNRTASQVMRIFIERCIAEYRSGIIQL